MLFKRSKNLKECSYVFVSNTVNKNHNNGMSCSGSLQLALSTLCKPIIVKAVNQYLQIENALEFNSDTDKSINID